MQHPYVFSLPSNPNSQTQTSLVLIFGKILEQKNLQFWFSQTPPKEWGGSHEINGKKTAALQACLARF
jgi:hypothetical protein